MRDDNDDTVRLKIDRAPRRKPAARLMPWLLATAVIAAAAAGGTWWFMQPAPAPSASAAPPTSNPPAQTAVLVPPALRTTPIQIGFAPPVTPPDALNAREATAADILADNLDTLAIYRFAPLPGVIVLQFPSLHQQAMMLNRVAALVEKAGFPHDQVISRGELDDRIRAEGGVPDTFYYGHDYRAADLIRFFALATDLDPEEARLKALVQQAGWITGDPPGALISLVRLSASDGLDEQGRDAILQHELSHAVYFTNPAYSAFCQHFWRDVLSDEERTKFTDFLAGEGYDPSLSDLMVNEMQAYLEHTPDRRFFSGAAVGITPTRLNELRQIFVVGMPPGWLRDHTSVAALP